MTLTAVVFVPLVAWHAYRAIRALRTGVFKSFGDFLNRDSEPDLFWFRVTRECLLAALFGALLLSLLFERSRATSVWLFGSYVAVYITLIFTTIMRRLHRPDHTA